MKLLSSLLFIIFSSCVSGKNITYIGSTPANSLVVRNFLGIPASDSVDFIRWKINLHGNEYALSCNYGIGKPNTSGFMEGGKWVEMNGKWNREANYLFLHSADKTLGLFILNSTLVHLINTDRSLLAGTGGWSYTLNLQNGTPSDGANTISKEIVLRDSVTFHGRTPCWNFPLVHTSPQCLKKKWSIIFYADSKTNQPATYSLNRTARGSQGTAGKWKIVTGKDGRIIYRLFSETEADPLELLVLDENVVGFIDKQGRLLVGNEDFSFTLSKK